MFSTFRGFPRPRRPGCNLGRAISRRSLLFGLVLGLVGGLVGPAVAQTLSTNQVWKYRLLGSSTISYECLVCGLVTPPLPLRGSFDLVLAGQTPIATTYGLTNIEFASSPAGAPEYQLTGGGSWQIGGEVAVVQSMTLKTAIQAPTGGGNITFTNSTQTVEGLWPVLEIDLDDTSGGVNRYHLHLVAAPLREIWFSPSQGFTPGNGAGAVSPGDLISDSGRLVKSGAAVVAAFALPSGTYPLAAVDVAPGGAVFFSLAQDVTSPTLGLLRGGDLLSDRGRVVATNQALTTAFGLKPPVPDAGLQGVQVMDNGEIYFCMAKDITGPSPGSSLSHGNILSNKGAVVASNQALLAKFHPEVSGNLGLTSFHAWPSGEIWFSVGNAFTDTALGAIGTGDLLSNQGYIVFRNTDLTSAFEPSGDLSDFGLSGIFVVTDIAASQAPPNLLSPVLSWPAGDVALGWSGQGRVFQVLKTADLLAPFGSAGPVVPGTNWTDPGALFQSPAGVYQLRQW